MRSRVGEPRSKIVKVIKNGNVVRVREGKSPFYQADGPFRT